MMVIIDTPISFTSVLVITGRIYTTSNRYIQEKTEIL